MRYNQNNYVKVFGDDPVAMETIRRSEEEPSLSELVQKWLERTPGLEEDSFNFWSRYKRTVDNLLDQQKQDAEVRLLCHAQADCTINLIPLNH